MGDSDQRGSCALLHLNDDHHWAREQIVTWLRT